MRDPALPPLPDEPGLLLPPPEPTARGFGLWPLMGAGLMALGYVFWPAPEAAPRHVEVSIAAFGSATVAPAPQAPEPIPLPDLLTHDAATAARFLRGLRGFDTAGLWAYAQATERDLALRGQPMMADLKDALTLIRHELARRGAAGGAAGRGG